MKEKNFLCEICNSHFTIFISFLISCFGDLHSIVSQIESFLWLLVGVDFFMLRKDTLDKCIKDECQIDFSEVSMEHVDELYDVVEEVCEL